MAAAGSTPWDPRAEVLACRICPDLFPRSSPADTLFRKKACVKCDDSRWFHSCTDIRAAHIPLPMKTGFRLVALLWLGLVMNLGVAFADTATCNSCGGCYETADCGCIIVACGCPEVNQGHNCEDDGPTCNSCGVEFDAEGNCGCLFCGFCGQWTTPGQSCACPPPPPSCGNCGGDHNGLTLSACSIPCGRGCGNTIYSCTCPPPEYPPCVGNYGEEGGCGGSCDLGHAVVATGIIGGRG